jgi:hypothetical protein
MTPSDPPMGDGATAPTPEVPEPTLTAAFSTPPARRRNPLLVWVIAAPAAAFFVGLAVGLAVNDSGGTGAADDDLFATVKEHCATGSSDVRIGDGGDTLSIDRAGAEEMPGATMTQFSCILAELDVPDAVVDRMNNTRALDGYQEAEFDGIAVSWTYHPDDGVNMTFTMAD